MSTSRCVFLLLAVLLFDPALSRVVYGPETQSDRLHRLMHADGANVKEEDAEAEKAAERKDKLASKGKIAPPDQEQFLHGVGMHGDRKKTDYEAQAEEKPSEAQNGPCLGMDCLHGVLMHNDKERGESHDHDHAEAAKKAKMREERDKKKVASVEDPHEMVHGHRKSIEESAADNLRYESHRVEGAKTVNLELKPPPEPSYFQAFLAFLKRKLIGENEEEEEIDEELKGERLDMRHELESIGRTGILENMHAHDSDKKNKREEREEHNNNAHREH